MTTIAEAREAIYSRFQTNWESLYPDVPYVFDNEAATPPASGSAWTRVSVRNFDSRQDTLGAVGVRRWRRRGVVFIQLFTPIDAGVGDADDFATAIRNVFEGASFGGLDCEATLIRERMPDGRWWATTTETAFSYYETR